MLKTFENKQTSWEGLWYHPENTGFSSAVLNLSKLKEFKGPVRIYVRKNKYYNHGENGRPNYLFCIKDAKGDTFTDIGIEDDSRCAEWIWSEMIEFATIFEGYECSRCSFANGYRKTKFCPDCGAKMMNGE